MAFNDTLFQLGMDLTRSSTAQKEETLVSAPVAQEDCERVAPAQDAAPHAGRSLFIDLHGARHVDTARSVEKALRQALEFTKSCPGNIHVRRTVGATCLSGTVCLGSGQISLLAWPGAGHVAIDLVGTGIRPEIALAALADAFGAREAVLKRLRTPSDKVRRLKAQLPQDATAPGRPARRPSAKGHKARAAA